MSLCVYRNIDLAEGHAWHVVHVLEGREQAALHAMFNDGFQVYMPGLVIETVYRCHSRRTVRLPLLPGYLFAGLDPAHVPDMRRWSRQGVDGLLMRVGMPGIPATLSGQAIMGLWLAEQRGLLKRRLDKRAAAGPCRREDTEAELARSGLAEGARVRWAQEDALKSIAARIVEAEPDMRLTLVMHWFGRELEVRGVPVASVEAI